MVTSHQGRPEEGVWSEENSLRPVAENIAARLGKPVRLIKDWVENGFEVAESELVVLENCRINKGEKKNVDETAQKYAKLCDVFVMDAFGTAHRAEASTHGIAKYAPVACAGILLTEELDVLTKALLNPSLPYLSPSPKKWTRWWLAAASPIPSSKLPARIPENLYAKMTWFLPRRH